MLVDVRIGKSSLVKDATCLRAGLWRFLAYSPQNTLLPFMSRTTTILLYATYVDEVTVDYIIYERAGTFADLAPGRFFQDGTVCYFIVFDYNVPWAFPEGIRIAFAIGLTTGASYLRDMVLYRGGLNYYPTIKETADNIEAAKMKFNTGSITLDNTGGVYDDAYSYFGNPVKVFMRDDGAVYPLYEYYIKNINAKLTEATLTLGDKRERLSQKIPLDKFTLENYPYMQNPGNPEQKSKNLGKIMADAYGYCINIPAVCIDQFQVYESGSSGALKSFRTFKVCRKITRLDKVMVKMTQPDGDTGSKEVWTDQKALGHIRSIDYNSGEFTMNVAYCMPPFTDYSVPEIFDVVVAGVFGLPESDCTPAKIIADILLIYGGIAFNDKYYNTEIFNSELSPLARVGICINKEKDIFSVIEQIQNASNYSFQFVTDFDRFSAKRNDNGRQIKARIKEADILELSNVEYDTNTDEYATIIDIGYNQNYLDDINERIIDKSNRDKILILYNVEKSYSVDSYLYNKADAEQKVSLLAKYFSGVHPVINNITLFGKAWFDLRCYDIVDIDLRRTENVPKHENVIIKSFGESRNVRNIMGVENAENRSFVTVDFNKQESVRPFIGRIKAKIISVEKNTKNETVKINVVKLEDIPA
jgi:hypothetical protein